MNRQIQGELTAICTSIITSVETITDATISSYQEDDELAYLKLEDDYSNEHELPIVKINETWVIWNFAAEFATPISEVREWLIHNLASRLADTERHLHAIVR